MKSLNGENGAEKIKEIDALDRHLIYWLDRDCRVSLRSLARRLRTSPARLHYRRERLVESGVIRSFFAVIDYRKLGYRAYAMHYKLQQITPGRQEKLLRELIEDPRILEVMLTEGSFDLQVCFLAPSIDDASDKLWSIRESLGSVVVEEKLTVRLKSYLYHHDEFLPRPLERPGEPLQVFDRPEEILKLAEEDHRLLRAMADNADWPIWKLAEAAGLGGSAAWSHIRKLEKQKVILGYRLMLDPDLPGFVLFRVFVKLHYLPPERREAIMRYLQALPRIYRCTFTFGDFDLSYDAIAPDIAALRSIMNEVYRHFERDIIRQEWVRAARILKFRTFESGPKTTR